MNINPLPEIQEFLEKYECILKDEWGIVRLQSDNFYKTLNYTDLRVWYSIFMKTNPNM